LKVAPERETPAVLAWLRKMEDDIHRRWPEPPTYDPDFELLRDMVGVSTERFGMGADAERIGGP
jgi:hypothetical protein